MEMKQNSELHLWENRGVFPTTAAFSVLSYSFVVTIWHDGLGHSQLVRFCLSHFYSCVSTWRCQMFGSKQWLQPHTQTLQPAEETIKLILVLCNQFGYLCRI